VLGARCSRRRSRGAGVRNIRARDNHRALRLLCAGRRRRLLERHGFTTVVGDLDRAALLDGTNKVRGLLRSL